MNSFKVYLPSNACQDIYPHNTPTNYCTRFNNPISLDGKWEVGVETIAYSSHINDKEERSRINLNVWAGKFIPVNDLYPYKFKLKKDGMWKGIEGIVPQQFETDSSRIESIIQTLNDMNDDILVKSHSIHLPDDIFSFTLNNDSHVVYQGKDDNFALKLTSTLARVLGFGYTTTLHASNTVTAKKREIWKKSLTQDDYLIRYMNVAVQDKQKRVIIKPIGQNFDGKVGTFLKLWEKMVTDVVDIRAEFKGRKLILHNHRKDIAFTLSPDFFKTFDHDVVIIGGGSYWASGNSDLVKDHRGGIWFIDTFNSKLDLTSVDNYVSIPLYIYPWRCKTLYELLHMINAKVKSVLRK